MSEASKTCDRATSTASRNVTSSPASAVGVSHSESQAYQMTDLFGQEVVLANPSASQAKAKATRIGATFGRRGTGSSASAVLQLSLANRLQEKLASGGSTMFSLTWKTITTPSRRRICALQASEPITSGAAFSGPHPTPRASMGSHMIAWARAERGEHRSQLEDWLACAYLAAGGARERGLHIDPFLCATTMGYPTSWLDSATPLSRKSRQPSSSHS